MSVTKNTLGTVKQVWRCGIARLIGRKLSSIHFNSL